MDENKFIEGLQKDGIGVIKALKLTGNTIGATTAGTTNPIRAYLYDENGNILYSIGLEVPTDATAGYAKGALHVDTNVATGTTGLYVNVGTTASCNFDAVTDA